MAHDNAEPSVEEILASIKKVMAADSKAARGSGKPADLASSYHNMSRRDDGRDDKRDANDNAGEPVLELGAFAQDDTGKDDTGDEADSAQTDKPLVSDERIDSMRSSLAALATLSEPGKAPQIVRSGETSMEGLLRDMLRPMLKEWLDENLPPLVEQMVAGEIRRITRKGN